MAETIPDKTTEVKQIDKIKQPLKQKKTKQAEKVKNNVDDQNCSTKKAKINSLTEEKLVLKETEKKELSSNKKEDLESTTDATILPSNLMERSTNVSEDGEFIKFKDKALKTRLLSRVTHKNPTEITKDEALKTMQLDLSYSTYDSNSKKIRSIDGLQYFTNLTNLDLHEHAITDVTSLANLTKLTELNLSGNLISDIIPLKNFENIKTLNLENNSIVDLQPLSKLTKLETLNLKGNTITDLKPLSTLQNIETLNLDDNSIVDLKSLPTLKNIKTLSLDKNSIVDLQPLSKLTTLETLSMCSNKIENVTALSTLKNLHVVKLSDNHIGDINPLYKLEHLYNEDCSIRDQKIIVSSFTKTYIDHYNLPLNLSLDSALDLKQYSDPHELTLKKIPTNGFIQCYFRGERPFIGFPVGPSSHYEYYLIEQWDGDLTIDFNPYINKIKRIVTDLKISKAEKQKELEKIESGNLTVEEFEKDIRELAYKSLLTPVDTPDSSQNQGTNQDTQTEDISGQLEKLLGESTDIKASNNYKNADKEKQDLYNNAITSGQAVYDKLSSTPEQVKAAAQAIQDALSALNGDHKSQTTLEGLQQEQAKLQQQITQVKADKTKSEEEKNKEISKLNSQITDLGKQIEQLIKDKNTLQGQLDAANGKIQTLSGELEKAKQQGTADKATIQSLTEQLQQTKDALEKLKSDKTLSDQKKQAEIDKLNGQIANLGKQIEQLTKDKNSLIQQLQKAQENLNKLQSELEKTKVQNTVDKATIEQLNKQITTLKQQVKQLQDDKIKSEQEKQTEIDKLNNQIANLKKQIEQLSTHSVEQPNGKALVAPLVNEKPEFDLEKYKKEHPEEFAGTPSEIGELPTDPSQQGNYIKNYIDYINNKINKLKDNTLTSEQQTQLKELIDNLGDLPEKISEKKLCLDAINRDVDNLLNSAASKKEQPSKPIVNDNQHNVSIENNHVTNDKENTEQISQKTEAKKSQDEVHFVATDNDNKTKRKVSTTDTSVKDRRVLPKTSDPTTPLGLLGFVSAALGLFGFKKKH